MNKFLKNIAVSLSLLFILCGCSSQNSIANSTGTASTSALAATVYNSSATNSAAENSTTTNNTTTTPTTDNSATNKQVKKLTDTVVSKSQYDINSDGEKEDIEIVLTDGRYDEDKELWAGNGPKWIGNFLIRVVSGQKVLYSQSLNELMDANYGETLSFWAPEFTLELKDYNSDKKIDFNLGQYFSSNGNTYMLFTIDAYGKISSLPIENMGSLFVSGTGHTNSTDQIVSDAKSIKVRFYDNTQGEYFEASYKWNSDKKMFSLIKKEIIKL